MAVKKNKKQNNNVMSVILIIAIVFAIWLAYSFITQQVKINSLNKEIKQLEAQISDEEKRSSELEEKMKEIDTPEYIEKIAREELGMVAPDEIIFMEAPKN